MSVCTMVKGHTISARVIQAKGRPWAFYTLEKDKQPACMVCVPLPQRALKATQTALAYGLIWTYLSRRGTGGT
jgi:hypothetical protein